MKNLKKLNILLIAIFTFFVGIKVTNAVPSTAFYYDIEVNFKLPDTLVHGENEITLSAHVPEEVKAENLVLNYNLVEIDKATYDQLKALQDKIDAKETIESGDADVEAFEGIIVDNELWCYEDLIKAKITFDSDYCGTKYYILLVDAEEPNVILDNGFTWEYQTARVYEIEGTATDCDPDVPETPDTPDTPDTPEDTPDNPNTGLSTPYIICGALVLGSIIAIVVSKKEKFM